jgi:hypothetical protein
LTVGEWAVAAATGLTMIEISAVRLRSNPQFHLLPFDALAAQQKEALRGLEQEPDFFGVLVPPEGSCLPMKSISRDAALLFMALRDAACLPHLLGSLFGKDASARLRSLILDGVFEVELAGQFVSGPAALPLLGDPKSAAPTTRVAQLSEAAIVYAAALEGLPLQDVANRLYLFNTAPATPAWLRQIADDGKFDEFLCDGSATRRLLQSRWKRETVGDSWIAWAGDGLGHPLPYKLYVSPAPEGLPATFAVAAEAFARTSCTYFKIGQGPLGLLRPDKLVAYFRGLEDLHQAADLIRTNAARAAPQGVPFTAPIDAHGLLSWGMDPPRFEQVLAHQQLQSWRQWLTARVAVYVAAAKEAHAEVSTFVRNRIGLDGVDPATWNPDLAIWRGPVGAWQDVR